LHVDSHAHRVRVSPSKGGYGLRFLEFGAGFGFGNLRLFQFDVGHGF